MSTITPAQARAQLQLQGISVSQWAAANGFSNPLVLEVLNGKRKCVRGQSHNIAVALGIKEGEICLNPANALKPISALPESEVDSAVEPTRHLEFSAQAAEAGFALLETPKHMRVACDEAMVREFTGSNHSELAVRWKVSVQWVYHCVKTAHSKPLD